MRRDGTQQNVIDTMQTRMELYDRIDYHTFEQKLDALFAAKKRLSQRACSRRRNDNAESDEGPGREQAAPSKFPNKFKKRTAWPKQKYSVAPASWPGGRADRTVHRGPGRRRPDLSRLRRARTGGRRQFEEVAYLLLYGELPTKAELAATSKLSKAARPAASLKEVLERIPADAHPMDVMRTGCSLLGNPSRSRTSAQRDKTDRLLAAFPAIMLLLVPLQPQRQAHRLETDETPSAATSCTCCTARSRASCTSR
jgi:hypothetical protein